MSIAEEIAAESQRNRRTQCGIGSLLDRLEADDRRDVVAALEDMSIPSTVIARVLQRRGWQVSDYTLNRHRRGSCKCEP